MTAVERAGKQKGANIKEITVKKWGKSTKSSSTGNKKWCIIELANKPK